MVEEFRNEPFSNFADPAVQGAYRAALGRVAAQLGGDLPLIVAGRRIQTREQIASFDPSDPARVVGRAAKGDRTHAEQALRAAQEAFRDWSHTPAEARARILFRAAAIMRRRKFELAAWLTYEVGKNAPEADADVAEAIDFLEFYGREMLRLAGPQPLTRVAGEDNELYYRPLGVGVVHSPFNFPFAILAGMTAAAIVAGNTVVVKPSALAPAIAYRFFEVLEEAGLPPGVANLLFADPVEVGDFLTLHPAVHFISFTGSRQVGCHIHAQAAQVQPGQRWLKRVIAEMGGKDAIVVDRTADLDAAAEGIVSSAFGFSGQKCSACSRAIVEAEVYDAVLERVVDRTRALRLGAATELETQVGPVVSAGALDRILSYVAVGRGEGRLVLGGDRVAGAPGWLMAPTIFADVAPRARIAQEEIFGPVLAFLRADDFADALRIANETDYGLTGAVYSRDRAHLEQARREFLVGNLYFNRKCTGALVGAHPFGGFHMSGTDSKAGGRDYLLLFTQAQTVSERL